MEWRQHLAHFLAAVVLIAGFALPSIAQAHEGHAHTVPALVEMKTGSGGSGPAVNVVRASSAVVKAVAVSHPEGPIDPQGCDGHCCGNAAGMACCGAALAPDLSNLPLLRRSMPFLIGHVLMLPGLAPEALPKPPKTFA
jgi:hypothetical protein